MLYKFAILLFCCSIIGCSPHVENSNPVSNITGDHGSSLLNPFGHVLIEETSIYLIGAIFVVLFTFIKLGVSKEFNYCFLVRFRNCEYEGTKPIKSCLKNRCIKHRTCAAGIFPESAFLITSGIIPAVIMLRLDLELEGTLDPKLVFKFLLIPIIMAAGWNTDKITFNRNVFTILWFAIIGTIVNAAILMPFFYFGSKTRWGIFNIIEMDLVNSGLYAILICAVDPVAVLSVFEAMHIDKLVYSVVFGESLLNDGVAVVFYNAFDGMRNYKEILFFESVGIVFVFFIYAFCISVVLATIMAVIISFSTKLFFHQQPIQFVVIISLNYLTYILGDSMKGSGILSLYFCVLIQRQYVQANLSYTSNTIIFHLLNQLALVAEGVIFILMGFTAFSHNGITRYTDIGFSLFLIFICYVSRYPVVYGLGYLANLVRNEKLSYKRNLFIQSHGGLRGAIGFSLALTIDHRYPNKYYYQTATALMVFFSVYILGATIKPLVNLCKIPIESHEEKNIFETLQDRVTERSKEGVKAIIGSTSLRLQWERYYTIFNNKYLKKWLMDVEALERNVSHSGVIKRHRDQSVSEAQDIAGSHGSLMIKDAYRNGGDARIKMYKTAWNSFVHLESLDTFGKRQQNMLSGSSVPDMSMMDQTITRRDIDDQMWHHNRLDGIGRKFQLHDQSDGHTKRKEKLKVDKDNHRSHDYKHQARMIEARHKNSKSKSGRMVTKFQYRLNQPAVANKYVTFNCVNGSDIASMFVLQDTLNQGMRKGSSLSNNNNIANQSYANKAYDDEESSSNSTIKRRSVCELDKYLPFELPWKTQREEIPQHVQRERNNSSVTTYGDEDVERGGS